MKCGRVHLSSWAQAELPLALDLLAGNDDVRPDAPDSVRRALSVLPGAVCGRPRVRADAGYPPGERVHPRHRRQHAGPGTDRLRQLLG